MIAKQLISDAIPVVKTSDTGNNALQWMEIHRVSHLPIVNNEEFLGLISDTDIYDNNCGDDPIGNHNLSLVRPFVFENQHIFEIMDLCAKMKLTIVPVLDVDKNYLGAISLFKLVTEFSKMTNIEKAASIIVLEMTIQDYSLHEISGIVESNNAKIMMSYVSVFTNSTQINVTIKVDVTDIASILQTFDRYDYRVKASFLAQDMLKVFYQDRYDSFINYLNI
ncbi:MAG: CBS domain-containing protein [Bacteroidales bacterium]|nr:CBS domain-containing protein [Bacteroidales bacterium]MDD4216454.1 CBS domain-containing protein [Bacteroidales bacterium]